MTLYNGFDTDELRQMLRRSIIEPATDPLERTYYFSNDSFLEHKLQAYRRAVSRLGFGDNDAALICGPGAVLSYLPYLPKTIIMADKDPDLLRWTHLLVLTMQQEADYKSFKHRLIADEHEAGREIPAARLLALESSSMGDSHFLASAENYALSRQALEEHDFLYAQVDFGNSDDIAGLADALQQKELRLAVCNLTNLHPFIAYSRKNRGLDADMDDVLEGFGKLSFRDDALFLARSLEQEHDIDACMPPITGIESYISKMSSSVAEELRTLNTPWEQVLY